MTIPVDARWLPDDDFRFRLGTGPGDDQTFFDHSPDAVETLAERRQWLTSDESHCYIQLLPEGDSIAMELLEHVSSWRSLQSASSDLWSDYLTILERLRLLGQHWEPDFVLLAPRESTEATTFAVVGGCVCFPSGWRLTDKLGQSVEEVHDPVPGLNGALASPIDRLIGHLKPGKCLLRANWGVSRFDMMNQHVDRCLPAIEIDARADQIWLRREDQCLFTLPRTGGVVFGIRVSHIRWDELHKNPIASRRIVRALQTMPDAMLEYKRIKTARETLIRLLDSTIGPQRME
jgi:hypothetical protein